MVRVPTETFPRRATTYDAPRDSGATGGHRLLGLDLLPDPRPPRAGAHARLPGDPVRDRQPHPDPLRAACARPAHPRVAPPGRGARVPLRRRADPPDGRAGPDAGQRVRLHHRDVRRGHPGVRRPDPAQPDRRDDLGGRGGRDGGPGGAHPGRTLGRVRRGPDLRGGDDLRAADRRPRRLVAAARGARDVDRPAAGDHRDLHPVHGTQRDRRPRSARRLAEHPLHGGLLRRLPSR